MAQKAAARIAPGEALDTVRLTGPALRGFFGIAQAWGLSAAEAQTLLGAARSTYHKYQAKPESARLSRDTLERISYVLGIYKALNILLPRGEAADAWVKRPNADPPFGGRSALDVMLGGNVADLFQVRAYLDGQRGW